MAISITQVYGLCTAILNAATDTYGTLNDPLRLDTEIKDAIKAADREVAQVIIDTDGHRRRADFAVLQDVTSTIGGSGNSGLIAFPIFAVQIDGKPAKFVPPDTFRDLTVTTSFGAAPLTTCVGFYTVEQQMLGAIYSSSVKVQIIKYTEPAGDTLASPEEYLMAVVCGALAILFPKEGAYVEAATHYASLFGKSLDLIRSGASAMPAVGPFVAGERR